MSLLRAVRYDNAFLFAYSQRDKTHAARHLPDDVPEAVKAARLQEAMAAYKAGLAERCAAEVGRLHLVLAEGAARKSHGCLAGKTCSMKKVVFRDVPLPPSLAAAGAGTAWPVQPPGGRELAEGAFGGALASEATLAAVQPTSLPGGGPRVAIRPGDYVAVRVDGFSNSTLVATPIARTGVAEFAELFGNGVPLTRYGAFVHPSLHANAAQIASSAVCI